MSWTLLVVATTVFVSLLVLAVSLQRIAGEVKRLGYSMRRLRAVAVANDDLRHHSIELSTRAAQLKGIEPVKGIEPAQRFRPRHDPS